MKNCNGKIKNFPGGPVIKTLPSNPRDAGLLPGQGQATWPASWETYMQEGFRKQQLELDMEQQTGSK